MARPSALMVEQLQDVGTCGGNVPITIKSIGQYGPRHIMGTVSITAGGNRYPQEYREAPEAHLVHGAWVAGVVVTLRKVHQLSATACDQQGWALRDTTTIL